MLAPELSPRVLVIGDVMTDILVRPEGPIAWGSDRRAAIAQHPGGSGCNQAAWLAHCGLPVGFIGRVGERDFLQQQMALREAGVLPLLSADPQRETGTLVALVMPDGERSFLTDRGANLGLCAADLRESWLDNVAVLHVSAYSLFAPGPRAAVLDYMALARRNGVTVTVDPASVGFLEEVGAAGFLDWTRDATTIFANADEAACLTGESEPEAQLAALLQSFPRVVLKRGAAGALYASAGERSSAPAEPIEVVDTTGAGDAFFAGFTVAELDGLPVRQCLEAGNRLGAIAATQLGARPPHSP